MPYATAAAAQTSATTTPWLIRKLDKSSLLRRFSDIHSSAARVRAHLSKAKAATPDLLWVEAGTSGAQHTAPVRANDCGTRRDGRSAARHPQAAAALRRPGLPGLDR